MAGSQQGLKLVSGITFANAEHAAEFEVESSEIEFWFHRA
jgi:hypothetical protein